jgi:hypothetical protein
MPLQITKTPHRNTYLASLAKVNDQLCFYLFSDAELLPRLSVAVELQKDDYTPNVFPQNVYASRIHVTMSELVAFRGRQFNQTLGMSFAFGVEQLLLYVKDALKFWAETNGVELLLSDPVEDCIEKLTCSPRLVRG